ncbi:DUF3422 family protein [Aestuariispira insulae]|uniref:Putative membrane-anchored protein n=1 Tax=Aestuariispira insulae TaxID=1461337 RepID=A0A3D9H6B0_9PROT|nr:DUF3422 domain-containing protein [Aestuariispira insulae]RED45045.1 putative membrane-anchored protein [Aestuariispira insulae]
MNDQKKTLRTSLPPEIRDHPLRYDLSNEMHARPFEKLSPPMQISYYSMTTGEGNVGKDLKHLRLLCERLGVNPPAENASYFRADFGAFRLRWERHTEFTTYTFMRQANHGEPFQENPVDFVPPEWLESLPGDRMVGAHLCFLPSDSKEPDEDDLHHWFVDESLLGSQMAAGLAQFWTDMRIHSDGHSRILIRDQGMHPAKAGRMIQRLLEIETYRNMALLSLPLARSTGPKTAHIDTALAGLTSRMAEPGENTSAEDDGEMLHELSGLSARIERLAAAATYRFSATRAYYALVQSRLAELEEERIPGYQRLSEFLDRRLAPAMRTVESAADRLADLSRRATRAANLLRTRVDFAVQEQNQHQLKAVARRSQLQLRLQETVEGLSVAAITYYAVGLMGYGAKAAKTAGLPVDVSLVTGISIPVIGGLVWLGMRRVRRAIMKDDGQER